MTDTPKDDKPDLPWVPQSDGCIPPGMAAAYIRRQASIYAPGMDFPSFVHVPPSDGYVPDPQDEPSKLLASFIKAQRTAATNPALLDQLKLMHQLVGELSSLVSEIELGWYLAFTCLLHQAPRQAVDALINSQRTGEGQRQIILATANAVLPADSDFLSFFGQLKGRTDKLMGRRNDAIHCIIRIADFIVPPRIIAQGTTKPSKLANKGIEAELKSCIEDATKLIDALAHFLDHVDTSGKASPALVSPQPKAGWKNPLSDTPQA